MANRQTVKNLFHEAVEIASGERQSFLDRNCADTEVRFEVESLLEAHERAENFIASPVFLDAEVLPTNFADEFADENEENFDRTGEKVGNYEIVREIGRGGMGAVYLARRANDDFVQQVAVKIVKRGMDTDFVLKRFRQERRILASLNHPNIAKLFEGGTTRDGTPYFVLEYVDGENLHSFCSRKNLPLAERLTLFREVCAALTYAHQNLVVHRDLKPSNILITPEGVPKLLDFGIAKLLTDDESTSNTTGIYRLLTPEYASPEQVRGERITTASDVYSLGVLLYELLTAHSPYRTQSKSFQEIIRAVCETEPVKPSEATFFKPNETQTENADETRLETSENPKSKIRNLKLLSGDLDNIILKALQKEPLRRYASVQEFSEDIRRYLSGLPVAARPDTVSYRVGKFVSRHKTAVASAVFVGLLLFLTTTFAVRQAVRADVERQKAEARFVAVRQMTNTLLFEFHDAIENLSGATPARKMVIDKALPFLDNLAQEAADDDSLQNELAESYRKLGEIQGHPAFPNLGDVGGGIESFRKSIKIGEELVRRNPTSREYRFNLAGYYDMLGDMFSVATYETPNALENYQKALRIREELRQTKADDVDLLKGLSLSYERIGNIKVTTGELDSAIEYYQNSLAASERFQALEPANDKIKRYIYLSYSEIGLALHYQGKYRAALEQYEKSRASIAEQMKSEPSNNDLLRTRGIIDDASAVSHIELGEIEAATAFSNNALAVREKLFAADPTNIQVYGDLTVSLDTAGDLLVKAGDPAGALKLLRRSLEMREAALERDPTMTLAKRYIAVSRNKIAAALRAQSDLTAALSQQQKALQINRELSRDDPTNLELRRELAVSLQGTGEILTLVAAAERSGGKWREARALLEECRRLYDAMKANNQFFGADEMKVIKLDTFIAKYERVFR
jgi:eukaryotic-like serine/threonine-protein kinase